MDSASPSPLILSPSASSKGRFSFRSSTQSDCTLIQLENNKNDEEDDEKCYEERRVVSEFSKALNLKSVDEINSLLSKHKWLLNYKLPPKYSYTFLEPKHFKSRFNSYKRTQILKACYDIFCYDVDELLFFASALLDVGKLNEILAQCENGVIHQTRDSHTVLLFTLKLCILENEVCVDVVKTLVDHGVNINQCDPNGNTILDFIVELYKSQNHKAKENLIEILHIILEKEIFEIHIHSSTRIFLEKLEIPYDKIMSCRLDPETFVYNSIINNKKSCILNHKFNKSLIGSLDNQENTLLQMVITKFKDPQDILELVQILLNKGANPNKTTKRNSLAPLELAALKNLDDIFNVLLDHKNTVITENQFNNFIRWRGQIIKKKYVEKLLESKKCDVNFKSISQKNTPLHYSLIFNHENAIQQQLKYGASLLEVNSSQKCGLDFINACNLEKYFDSCIVLDNYNGLQELRYQISMNYNGLVNKNDGGNEIEFLDKIRKNSRLQHLLTHPIMHLFLNLKWFKIRKYYIISIILQAMICMLLYVGLYFYETLADWGFWLTITTVTFNSFLKLGLFLVNHKSRITNLCNTKLQIRKIHHSMSGLSLHLSMEIISIIFMILSLVPKLHNVFRPFVFVFVMINFLLTLGYHPSLSKWSAMLQQVFTTFTILSLYFFLPILAFSFGFNALFNRSDDSSSHQLFQNLSTSIFRTYIMIIGEFNFNTDDFPNASAYFMFILFAISMTMILMNFWTGVAVSDIGNIEKNSEVSSFKNIVIFLKVVNFQSKFCNCLGNPLLFPPSSDSDFVNNNNTSKKKAKSKNSQFRIDFLLNKEKQLPRTDLPGTVDEIIVNKIKEFIRTKNESTVQDEIAKLNEKLDKMHEILQKLVETMNK